MTIRWISMASNMPSQTAALMMGSIQKDTNSTLPPAIAIEFSFFLFLLGRVLFEIVVDDQRKTVDRRDSAASEES